MQRFILSVLAASFCVAGFAQAQRPHPVVPTSARWVINGHSTMALGTSVTDAFNEVKTSSGLGAGVEVGYRVTPRFWPMPVSRLPSSRSMRWSSRVTSASATSKPAPDSASRGRAARSCPTSAPGSDDPA